MSKKTIGTTPTTLFNQNPNRTNVTIRNESLGGEIVYISTGTSDGLTADSADYTISPGEEKTWIYREDGKDMRLPFSVIGSGAGAIIRSAEMSDPEVKL